MTRVDITQYLPGEPLAHDLFNGHGALVLKRGSRIEDLVRIAQRAEMRLYRLCGQCVRRGVQDDSFIVARHYGIK